MPSALILVSPFWPVLAQTFESCTRGSCRLLMTCGACCRVQPCLVEDVMCATRHGRLPAARKTWKATICWSFADPVCARMAHGGVQPIGDRDKRAKVGSDQGTLNGEI